MSKCAQHCDEVVEQLVGEGLVRLTVAARECGLSTSVWTLLRLVRSGRLEAVRVGGVWHTSTPALKRMLARDTAHATRTKTRKRTSVSRKRQRETARAYLKSVGLRQTQCDHE